MIIKTILLKLKKILLLEIIKDPAFFKRSRDYYPWTNDYLRILYPIVNIPKCYKPLCCFNKERSCTYSNIIEIDQSSNLVCQYEKRVHEAFDPLINLEKIKI